MAKTVGPHKWNDSTIKIYDPEPSESSDDDYMTAISAASDATYYTAISGTGADQERKLGKLSQNGDYAKILPRKHILPVEPAHEKNWSGRGQLVEFFKHGKDYLDYLLPVEEALGTTRSAIVQSVKCRRILLARKTVRCTRHFTKD
ncbi:hypothetical protein B0J11DRAFT_620552 [Dendryphion nanum]|uniref:Uncharacterized protein n=1 Tax=Dendryphion nanum TaxID=256645 RepID=A0A9P9CXN1_9PLEO|nr:hypothetical protein B0J11DRAFT_620552 [Dendryphion nanum]